MTTTSEILIVAAPVVLAAWGWLGVKVGEWVGRRVVKG
jgi:hypothetical protein